MRAARRGALWCCALCVQTHQLPEEKASYSRTKHELMAELDVAMGGRVAEELIFGADHVTTGAASDLEKATATARAMVTAFGMSDRIGLIALANRNARSPYGGGGDGGLDLSPQTRQIVDEEVTRILTVRRQRP